MKKCSCELLDLHYPSLALSRGLEALDLLLVVLQLLLCMFLMVIIGLLHGLCIIWISQNPADDMVLLLAKLSGCFFKARSDCCWFISAGKSQM